METILLLSGIGFIVIIFIIAIVLTINVFLKLETRLHRIELMVSELNTETPDVTNGLLKGLKELQNDDKKHLQFIELSRKYQEGTPIITSTSIPDNEKINSGGELIPLNLNDEEKKILKMFYDKE